MPVPTSSPVQPRNWLRRAAEADPAATALVAGSTTLTYAELAGAAGRWSRRLGEDLSLSRPSRVGVVASGTAATAAQLWGLWQSAHTAVLLAPGPHSHDEASLVSLGVSGIVDGDAVRALPGRSPQGITPPAHTWVRTSGSGGAPRRVVLTDGNVAAAVAASQRRLGNTSRDRWLLTLPLNHVGGASVLWRTAAAGGTVVLRDRFDPVWTARRFLDGDVTVASLVPTMLYRLLDVASAGYHGMRAVLVGGAATPDALVTRALDAGLPVVTTYGLTEACSQVATVRPGEMADSLGTVGRPLDGVDVTIREADQTGIGFITIDGPAVSPGYAGEPPRRGPHRTNDLGRFDAAGRLTVLGRGDDVIVTGGEKVIPVVVEHALMAHPNVAHAAVVGVPDEEWGEAVVAMVAVATTTSVAELATFGRASLPPAARPKRYVLVDALPMLPNGKIDRAAVRGSVAQP